MLKLNTSYFFIFLLIFFIEVCIAYSLKTGFIRHTFGDFLVIILLYCFLKSFINVNPIILSLIALGITFIVEFLQFFPFLEILGLHENHYAKLILGNTFQISDLVAYIVGALTIILIENKRSTA